MDCKVDLGEGGPENVKEGNRADSFGFCKAHRVGEYLAVLVGEAVVNGNAKDR